MALGFVSALADAIARQEGYAPGTRAWRNNNPGNLLEPTGWLYPELPRDSDGFIQFPTAAAGRAALEKDLQIKIDRGWDLRRLISAWAPPSHGGNDTEAYIANVSAWLGIPADLPLRSVAAVWPLQTPVRTPAPPASPPDFSPGLPEAPPEGRTEKALAKAGRFMRVWHWLRSPWRSW